MWRPFASQFVNHSYSDFLRKHCDRDLSQRVECRTRLRRFNETDLFPHKLHKQAFDLRAKEFQRLKVKLDTQRHALQQQEDRHRRHQRLLGRKQEQALAVRTKYKKEFQAYLRSMATNGVKLPQTKPQPRQSFWKRVDLKAVLALKHSSNVSSPIKSCR